MIIEISAAAAAAAFIVLIVYLITLIQSAKRSLEGTNETLNQIREEMEAVSKQSVSLMAASEKLVKEADVKLHTFDPFTNSIRQTGEVLEQVSASVKQVSAAVSRSASGIGQTVDVNRSRIAEAAELATIGVQLWQKWQSHRNAKSQTKTQSKSMEE